MLLSRFIAVTHAAFVGIVSACLLIAPLEAQQRELKTDGKEHLDAVLLLDASGSMRQTDPQRLRDEGAKLLGKFLEDGDRLAVYEFSDSVRQIRPLSLFDSAQFEGFSTSLASVDNSGKYTDISAAIKEARVLLERDGRPDANQVVILLSDGKMDPDITKGPTAQALVSELLNTVLPDMRTNGIKIHTLSFSDSADRDLLSDIALATDGVNWFTPDADKIHESYAELFLVLKKPQIVPLTGRGFEIDGGIEEATFYINREAGEKVILQSPEGEISTGEKHPESQQWYAGSNFDVVTITEPEEGTWTVNGLASAEGFATVLTDLKLITDWPNTFNAYDKVLLQARLYEEKKPINLPEMTGAVKYAIQIIPTDRVSEPVVREFMVDDGTQGDKIAGDGIFALTVSLKEAGEYRLKIVASGPTFQRQQQIPFRVKPRIISLAIEKEHGAHHEEHAKGESDAAAHGEGDEHHADSENEHGDEHADHAVKNEDGHGDEHSEHGDGIIKGGNDYDFVVTLSSEALALKQLEVKLSATDSQRRLMIVPLSRHGGKGDMAVYRASSKALPVGEQYEIQATMTGVSSKKEKVRAESDVRVFKKIDSGAPEATVIVLVEKEAEPEGFPFGGLLVALILNGLAGAAMFVLVQRAVEGTGGSLPEFVAVGPLQTALDEIRARTKLTEVRSDDPLFKNAAAASSSEVTTESPTQPEESKQEDEPAVSEEGEPSEQVDAGSEEEISEGSDEETPPSEGQ